MKIILLSIGTRGDMEPFLAIGEILKEKGNQVICAFLKQFRNLTENSNMEFASLGTKFIEMLDSDVGKAALGGSGSGLKKFIATVKLAGKQTFLQFGQAKQLNIFVGFIYKIIHWRTIK